MLAVLKNPVTVSSRPPTNCTVKGLLFRVKGDIIFIPSNIVDYHTSHRLSNIRHFHHHA